MCGCVKTGQRVERVCVYGKRSEDVVVSGVEIFQRHAFPHGGRILNRKEGSSYEKGDTISFAEGRHGF